MICHYLQKLQHVCPCMHSSPWKGPIEESSQQRWHFRMCSWRFRESPRCQFHLEATGKAHGIRWQPIYRSKPKFQTYRLLAMLHTWNALALTKWQAWYIAISTRELTCRIAIRHLPYPVSLWHAGVDFDLSIWNWKCPVEFDFGWLDRVQIIAAAVTIAFTFTTCNIMQSVAIRPYQEQTTILTASSIIFTRQWNSLLVTSLDVVLWWHDLHHIPVQDVSSFPL